MTRPHPTARAFAEALAPAVKWRRTPRWSWIVKAKCVEVADDGARWFTVDCGTGTIRVRASRDGIQRARRWLLFMACEDPKVAAFVEAAWLGQAAGGGAP